MKQTFVFIAGATNSGTGLLRDLMKPNPEMSVLPKEGHHYCKALPRERPGHKRRLFGLYVHRYRWAAANPEDPDFRTRAKKVYLSYTKKWDMTKPFLVEKSPHNLMRSPFMAEAFKPAKFVVIVRNPYAVCEGLQRRRKHPLDLCARHWRNAYSLMREDIEQYSLDAVTVYYEHLVSDADAVLGQIGEFLGTKFPRVDVSVPIKRQNMFNEPFSLWNAPDFNAESMKRLSALDKSMIWRGAGEEAEKWGYGDKSS